MTNHKKNLLISTLKMGLATLSSRVLGFAREILLAKIFGASGLTDAFHIAFRIPNMLRDLFAEGAFSSAFIPTFTGEKNKSDQDAINLFWSVSIFLLIVTGIISVLIIIFAPEIIHFMTNDIFYSDKERFEIAVTLTRLMAPFLTCVSLAALCMGVLNTYKMFFAPAMAPAVFNIIMILAMVFVPTYLKERGIHEIVSLGFGVIVGGFFQFLVQIPMLYTKGILKKGRVNLFSKSLKEILGRLSVGTIGVAATQVNLFVSTFLATGTVVGAVSWLQYAFRLFQFPVGILGVSIGNSHLVHFSEHWKSGNKDEAVNCLKTSYLTSLFTLAPALAILYALSYECATLSYQRGSFGVHDTQMVSETLKLYLLGLPFYGLYKVFSPTFYSLDRPKLPVIVSVSSIALNIVFCFFMVDRFGFQILALGTTLSMVFIIVVQSVFLAKILDLKASFFFSLRFFKISLAAIISYGVTLSLAQYLETTKLVGINLLGHFILCSFVGGVAYLVALCVMGDYRMILNFFSKILKRK